MGEISRRFDSAKEGLRQLSRTAPRDVSLPSVSESGSVLGWLGTDHDVTGREFNRLTRALQSAFATTNDNIIQIAKASGVMYQLADALESDYLAKFNRSINEALESGKKAEAAAEQAKCAAIQALKAQKTADGSIEVLKRNYEALKRTNDKLEDFRRQAEERLRALERENEDIKRELSGRIYEANKRVEDYKREAYAAKYEFSGRIGEAKGLIASNDNGGKIVWVAFGIAVAALVIALAAGIKSFVG